MESRPHLSERHPVQPAMTTPIPQVETSAAYVLWLLCLCGVCGGQRFYSGKIASGLIYLFTFGLFGFGQLLDLLLIPGMVEKRNIYLRGLYARNLDLLGIQPTITLNMGALPQPVEPFLPVADPAVRVSPMQKLLQVANDHGGTVSLAQVALHLGLEPEEIKSLLQEAERHGYAEICNDPETGAIRYRFDL